MIARKRSRTRPKRPRRSCSHRLYRSSSQDHILHQIHSQSLCLKDLHWAFVSFALPRNIIPVEQSSAKTRRFGRAGSSRFICRTQGRSCESSLVEIQATDPIPPAPCVPSSEVTFSPFTHCSSLIPSDIAERYGPPDVSFLPLAAGSVLPFLEDLFRIKLDHARLTSAIHCTPRDAVEIHQSMKSRLSIGIHWGTFTTKRHALETMMELKRECAVRRVSVEGEGEFRVVDAGRVIQL